MSPSPVGHALTHGNDTPVTQVITQSHDKYEAHIGKIQESHRKSKGMAEKQKLRQVPGSGGMQPDGQRMP